MNPLELLLQLVSPQPVLAGFGKQSDVCEDEKTKNCMFKGGKGSSPAPEKPVFRAPPAAPAVEEVATMEDAVSPEEEEKRKREGLKSGAKSLQIPTTTSQASTKQVGTGT